MSNKLVKNNINKAKRAGMSNLDILKVKELARKEAEKLEKTAAEKAFLYMLAIPLNVLCADYWSKTAKKRAPKFINDVLELYKSVDCGAVTDKELADFLYDIAGIRVETEWLERGGVNG
jgi:hypothetical protein